MLFLPHPNPPLIKGRGLDLIFRFPPPRGSGGCGGCGGGLIFMVF